MNIKNIDISKTRKAMYKQIRILKKFGVHSEEIDSDINYIGLVCCSNFRRGDFYRFYYRELVHFFDIKIQQIKDIRDNEKNILDFIPQKKDPRLESPLHDDYLSSLASSYATGHATNEQLMQFCEENSIVYNDFIDMIDSYYSSKIMF